MAESSTTTTGSGPAAGASARWVAYGEPALRALRELVEAAKDGDPLAPVTVVTPSPSVAVAVRRELARRHGSLTGVHLTALSALAEQLAAAHFAERGIEAGIDRELVVTAVRAALGRHAGTFAPIAHHRTTWESVAAAIADLGDCAPAARATVATRGPLQADLVRLHDDVVTELGDVGSSRALALAAELVDAGVAPLAQVGTVAVYLPAALSPPEVRLLVALAHRLPVRVLLGTAGRRTDDAALAARLAALGVPEPPDDAPGAAARTEVLGANDIDDEVRAAVRALLHHAEHAPGGPVPLHRMALVHPAGAPYAGVVAEVLRSAGIPFSGPSGTTLAQSAAGRVLLGLLDVVGSGFGRQEVVDLWSSGLVFDEHGVLPFARFDELTRRLGIVGGLGRWHEAITAAEQRDRRQLEELDDDAVHAAVAAHLDALAHLRRSLDVLEQLRGALPSCWDEVAGWAATALDRLCGPPSRRSWPDHELAADTAIRTALGRLGALGRVEPDPSLSLVRDTVRRLLDVPAPRREGTGTGLLVTTVQQPPLLPLEAVAVVGLVEGQLPATLRDDVLLGEDTRRSLGLTVADDQHRAQRRGFDASLASASALRVLTHARNDQRSGRALVPSRWLLDVVAEHTGDRPEAEALMEGRPVRGVTAVASFEAGLRSVAEGTTTALDAGERALAAVVRAGDLDGHPAVDEAIARGALAARSRRARAFTRFDGDLGGDGVDITELGALSPTSVETYAACPRRWFFGHVLGLGELDRPEAVERLQARDRGTLVHRVLERFFGEAIAADTVPAPGRTWSAHQRGRIAEIADEECDDLERRGLTGHARWWQHDREQIHGVLQATLARDDECRAELGTRPVAVEFTFGRRGEPPLEIDLGDTVVRLAGQADRVDRAPGALQVWDYKYAGAATYADLQKPEDRGGDPLRGGTKLQLVAYAMAAAEQLGVSRVHAHYWLLKPEVVGRTVGYEVDAALRERFRRVLAVVADGIADGRFPARPGPHEWHRGTFANCAWCEFDTICPGDRDVEWQRVRLHPSLEAYRRLAEEGSASVLDEEAP